MTRFVGQRGRLNRQRASQAVGFVAVAIALAVFIGWRAGLPLLARWGSGYSAGPFAVPMLAAFGLALVHPGKDSRFAFAVGLAGIAYAAVGLVVVFFNIEVGIERWLAPRAPLAAFFRVTSAGMLAFGLAAGALALSRFDRHRLAATVLASIVGGITVFSLLGYLSGVDTLYGSASVNSPSLPAAVGLLCVTVGIILRIGTMPVFRKPRPLWHLLVMLGCAIIGPLLLYGAYAGFRLTDAQLRNARESLAIDVRTLSANIDREVTGEIERLQALAASRSLRDSDFAEFQRQAEASLRLRQSGNIVLIDRNMQQLVNTNLPFGTPLPKSAIPKVLERAFTTGEPQVAGLFIGSVTKRLMFSIFVPVQIDGENRYVLGRSQDHHALARIVATNELPAGWQAVVSDAEHRIIARSKQQDSFVGKDLPPAQWHREVAGGVFEFIDSDGRPSLEASATSELTGWHTAIWAPKALLEAPVRAQWRTLGVMALLAIALVVASALWLGRIIAHAVGNAAQAAIASSKVGPPSPSQTPVAEVNAMMAELREITALLRESEATFRAMFEVSSVGKIEVEPNSGRLLRVNAAMCRFVGYSEAELLARTVFDITHPEDRHRASELLSSMVTGELAVMDIEKRYNRKDGIAVWGRTTANIIRDGSGRPLRYTVVIQDIDAHKQAEHDLQASKDNLQVALDAAQLGSWQYDPRHRVFSGDERAKEIFAFAQNEAPLEEVMSRVNPDDLEKVLAAIEESLDPVDPKRSATEFRLRRAHGEIRWVETLGLANFDGTGPERRAVSFRGTVQDVTERKERQEREHLLMREVNHRAKNMLSVVDAIAHQTATRNPEDFIERFSARIQSLSANQELLVRNEWRGVGIEDLVRAQLSPFADLIGSRIATNGPKLRLRAASAQAIGLALHELATNAGKYGALSTGKGRVDVFWAIDGDTLAMNWTERDGPPVSAPERRGFGTTVMKTMTERSVNGAVNVDYAPGGLTWRLTCPAASALESRW